MHDDGSDPTSGGFLAATPPPTSRRNDVRAPRLVGRDYPADPEAFVRLVASLLPVAGATRALGLVLPHGPLRLCGAVSASALRLASCDETAVVLAPNHAARGPRAMIASHGAWSIPGAVVPVDERLAESVRQLAGSSDAPSAFDDEPSIESILPLLVASRPRLSIVPILLHDVSSVAATRMGAAIADAIVGRGGGATIVATSNLVHYAEPRDVDAISRELAVRIASLDEAGFEAEIEAIGRRPGPTMETCGLGAIRVLVRALRALDVRTGEIGAIGNSASVDERGRCVGYGSIAFTSRG